MKIEVVSGQPNAPIGEFFKKLLEENGLSEDRVLDKMYIKFPEYRIIHPTTLQQEIREVVAQHIKDDKDLFVLTYNDHVFNAIRLEIKKHKFKNGRLYNVMTNGDSSVSLIDEDGRLSAWVDGIFDTWDNALTELLTD